VLPALFMLLLLLTPFSISPVKQMYISGVTVKGQPALPGNSVELDYNVTTLDEPITHFLIYLSCESPSICPLGPKINVRTETCPSARLVSFFLSFYLSIGRRFG
jgi:hypothetical protein